MAIASQSRLYPPAVYREHLDEAGFFVVHGLSRDEAETLLGQLGGLMEQPDGSRVYSVKAAPGSEALSSSRGTQAIPPHTEAPDYPEPPRYVALYCVHASSQGGSTLIADGRPLAAALPEEAQRQLRKPHRWEENVVAPVYDGAGWRFSYNHLRYGTYHPGPDTPPLPDSDGEVWEDVRAWFDAHAFPVHLEEGDLFVLHNGHVLHARSAFEDPARHLLRYWLSDTPEAHG